MSQASPEPNVEPARRKVGWRDIVRSIRRPKVLLTLALGFGSGLPFLLTGATFGLWLREHDISLAAIGFLSWVGLAYSFKFLWAPLIDKIDAPLLGFLGRRRSWMALSQIITGGALVCMAIVGPDGGLMLLGGAALAVAFASATQDIVVDAWRIESADDTEELALITSAFQLGYRFAILAANALILFVANGIGWAGAYAFYGAAMSIALLATLLAREPLSRAQIASPAIWTPQGMFDAIVGPFLAFLKTHGALAVLMLATISLYRLPDFVMGPMVGPFYVDIGIPRETIGSVRLTFGLVGTLIGIAAAGLSALRLGFGSTLLLGAILGPGSNIAYTLLAMNGYSPTLFAGVLFTENFSEGFAGAALVAYMSSLTSIGYTATQYALLSSFYAMLGKVLKGFSGQVVEGLQAMAGGNVLQGYAWFFLGTALVGIPALLLCIVLNRITLKRKREAEQAATAAPA
jgi:PAT family beta-lactamase induction signal transducer AmpG